MRLPCTVLTLCLAGVSSLAAQSSGTSDSAKIAAYLNSLPAATTPAFDEIEKIGLAANPLGCEDHPYGAGGGGTAGAASYLWQRESKPQLLEDYDKHRAFYGCADWHSGVNSTWMMVSLIRMDPTIAVAPAIRLELEGHIQKSNVDGEVAYFAGLTGPFADFERPYGYAWLLKLYGEAKVWDDPEGKRVAATLEPLAKWIATHYVDYLHSLNYPVRVGLHPNTALDMGFTLNYTAQVHDTVTQAAIYETALRIFGHDKHCATQSEPVFGDFASPCLVEAALMGRVLDPAAYSKWLGEFLPPVYSEDFQLYAKEIDAEHGTNRDTTGMDSLPNAHLIGLNFQRATDLLQIAAGLPQDDLRVPVYRKLAKINAKQGYEKIGAAGYGGTHWLATYALMYEEEAAAAPRSTSPAVRDKPKVSDVRKVDGPAGKTSSSQVPQQTNNKDKLGSAI
jgi:Protein of unknown function (DUF2891)